MKYFYIVFCLLFSIFHVSAQVIAYPSINDSKVLGANCADLHFVNPIVIGHQLNVSVSYYVSLSDAQNEANALERFYEPISNPQTIYVRVDSNLNSDFAIEEYIIDSAVSDGGPPPGISPCYFDACDVDGNGSEIIYLNNLRCKYDGYGFPTTAFCGSLDNEIETTYYLTENDAVNETNSVNPIYTLTSSQTFYRKIKNITTNEFLIDDLLNVNLVSCITDTDLDGIPDLAEDSNKNLLYDDDDTDQDGLKNYEDADDDGDGILTINEDYNNNGDPSDDDIDGSGVADYLEFNVTLSLEDIKFNSVTIYPNPAYESLFINSKEDLESVTIYNVSGIAIQNVSFKKISQTDKISTENLSQGVYFIKIKSGSRNEYHRFIKN
ncbi:T9SS type A sorting domain-containing protein [Confluentibacter citreus]|uniref:T9SS type A sorting domain-containing protein n=1 Tax=Confluentibacter citreus TaxID=2007307 RepID=UPI000C287612|nr:T9SS type A sorting domain-containing protein [Confluentibacter citreus]